MSSNDKQMRTAEWVLFHARSEDQITLPKTTIFPQVAIVKPSVFRPIPRPFDMRQARVIADHDVLRDINPEEYFRQLNNDWSECERIFGH